MAVNVCSVPLVVRRGTPQGFHPEEQSHRDKFYTKSDYKESVQIKYNLHWVGDTEQRNMQNNPHV